MWMFRSLVVSVCLLGFASLNLVAEERKPVAPQTESTIKKPVESPKKTRKEFKRQSYTELYRESYNPKDYSKRYREDYADNPIRTGSYDSRSRRLRSYRFDKEPPQKEPRQFTQGSRPLNAPPAQPAPAGPAVVVDHADSPLQPDRIFVRPLLRLPALYVYRALQRRAAERADEQVENATTPLRAPAIQAEPNAKAASLQSPFDLLVKRAKSPFAARNYFEAARRLERLLEERPDHPKVRYAYGAALFASGKYSRAAGFIQPAKNAAQRQGIALPAIGSFYSNQADFEHHQKRLKRYVERNPGDLTAAALMDLLE